MKTEQEILKKIELIEERVKEIDREIIALNRERQEIKNQKKIYFSGW